MSNSVLGSSKRTQKRLANVRADRHVESRESPSIDVDVGEVLRQLLDDESTSPAKKNGQLPSNSEDELQLDEITTAETTENADEKTVRMIFNV